MKRNKTSKAWIHAHVNDPYVQRAQADGYRARGEALGRWTELGRRLETGAVGAHDLAELEELGKVIAGAFADQRESPAR